MRTLTILLCVALGSLTACKGGVKATPSADAFKQDKVSPRDGVVAADGNKDAAIDLTIDGPIASILVMSVDEKTGKASGGQQWDTLVDNDVIPKATGSDFVTGASTWQLGVFDKGSIQNNGAGRVSLGEGSRALTLYLSDNNQLRSLKYVVVVARPDGSVVRSNAFSF